MTFKTRMELSLPDYRGAKGDGDLPASSMKLLENPSYATYRHLHNRVGQPYGWDRRARINDVAAMGKLLATAGIELWEFFDGPTSVGYAFFTCAADKTAELEDFGFFPEFCDRGHGQVFLPKILRRLIELGLQKVWLTTRSTNHSKVVAFYAKMGFEVTESIHIPDDAC